MSARPWALLGGPQRLVCIFATQQTTRYNSTPVEQTLQDTYLSCFSLSLSLTTFHDWSQNPSAVEEFILLCVLSPFSATSHPLLVHQQMIQIEILLIVRPTKSLLLSLYIFLTLPSLIAPSETNLNKYLNKL